jgi:23S rRNA (uracil1939-C5)-methyltransferase
MTTGLTIERIGAQGDGIARGPRGEVFVPFTLPGERVTASIGGGRADLLAVIEPSPDRVEPACRHFGTCGGCALQHWEAGAYRSWKRDKLVHALRGKGIETDVDPIVAMEPGSRRRAVFSARRTDRGVVLGFNQALSNTIVDIEECPVLLPAIVQRFGDLRAIAGAIAAFSQPFHLSVTHTASGLDIAAVGGGQLGERQRRIAIDLALSLSIARLSVDGEIVVEARKPMLMVGETAVLPPPGAFVQAVEDAEIAMADLVDTHLARSKRVADLFAGIGTFALRLARLREVHAVEGDAAAVASLDRAAREATGLRTVTVEKRDLFIRPLTFKELDARFDGLVFDPPRAGAEDQSKQIARSQVQRVAAVSCNPVTLARDLRILIDGGYQLKRVVPVDQFVWSPHLEAVALLEKPKRRR